MEEWKGSYNLLLIIMSRKQITTSEKNNSKKLSIDTCVTYNANTKIDENENMHKIFDSFEMKLYINK